MTNTRLLSPIDSEIFLALSDMISNQGQNLMPLLRAGYGKRIMRHLIESLAERSMGKCVVVLDLT